MVELDRRQFLAGAAVTVAAAPQGTFGRAGALGKADRELAAIGRATEWLNSPRLAPDSLAGKVVVVDFCTYTCINWLRTLPYVRAWAQKYAKGLVVLGVHTPEFARSRAVPGSRQTRCSRTPASAFGSSESRPRAGKVRRPARSGRELAPFHGIGVTPTFGTGSVVRAGQSRCKTQIPPVQQPKTQDGDPRNPGQGGEPADECGIAKRLRRGVLRASRRGNRRLLVLRLHSEFEG